MNDSTQIKFSRYPGNHGRTPTASVSLVEVADYIKLDDGCREQIIKVRKTKATYDAMVAELEKELKKDISQFSEEEKKRLKPVETQRKEAKSHLASVTFACSGTYRDSEHVTDVSGLCCLDFDHVSNDVNVIEELKHKLASDADLGAVLLFISPSGDGLKVVCQYDTEGLFCGDKKEWTADYERVHKSFENYCRRKHGLNADEKCIDIVRLCYLSHDPKVVLQSAVKNFCWRDWEPQKEAVSVSGQSSSAVRYTRRQSTNSLLNRWHLARADERIHGLHCNKMVCPNCGQLSFVPYVNLYGDILSEHIGKCDRKNKCKYHKAPKEYFLTHPDKITSYFDNESAKDYINELCVYLEKHPEEGEKLPTESKSFWEALIKEYGFKKTKDFLSSDIESYTPSDVDVIPEHYVTESKSLESAFGRFLKRSVGEARAQSVADLYHLGATQDGRVIFWQIDDKGRVRDGKFVLYGEDGHRVKDDKGAVGINWVSFRLKKEENRPDDRKVHHCLFGEHLLKLYPEKPICIVEAEKSAVICAALKPDCVWLATGGAENFSVKMCEALRLKKVFVLPDCDMFEAWQRLAVKIHAKTGCQFEFLDFYYKSASEEQKKAGWDIADFLLNAEV